jgi:hypothetical protein
VLPTIPLLLHDVGINADHIKTLGHVLLSRCSLATALYTGFTIMAFSGYATIYYCIIKETNRKEE